MHRRPPTARALGLRAQSAAPLPSAYTTNTTTLRHRAAQTSPTETCRTARLQTLHPRVPRRCVVATKASPLCSARGRSISTSQMPTGATVGSSLRQANPRAPSAPASYYPVATAAVPRCDQTRATRSSRQLSRRPGSRGERLREPLSNPSLARTTSTFLATLPFAGVAGCKTPAIDPST
jgi:hypothetical protein